jgi:hypothetical protein
LTQAKPTKAGKIVVRTKWLKVALKTRPSSRLKRPKTSTATHSRVPKPLTVGASVLRVIRGKKKTALTGGGSPKATSKRYNWA